MLWKSIGEFYRESEEFEKQFKRVPTLAELEVFTRTRKYNPDTQEDRRHGERRKEDRRIQVVN